VECLNTKDIRHATILDTEIHQNARPIASSLATRSMNCTFPMKYKERRYSTDESAYPPVILSNISILEIASIVQPVFEKEISSAGHHALAIFMNGFPLRFRLHAHVLLKGKWL